MRYKCRYMEGKEEAAQRWDALCQEIEAQRRQQQRVNLSRLPTEAKQRVWRYLQQQAPGIAALLSSTEVRELAARFHADLYIERSLITAVLGDKTHFSDRMG